MNALKKGYISFAFTIIIAMGLISLAYAKLYLPSIGEDDAGIAATVEALSGVKLGQADEAQAPNAKPASSVKEWKKEYKDPVKSLSKGTSLDLSDIQNAAQNMDIDALSNIANEKDIKTFKANAQELKKEIQSRSVPKNASAEQKRLMQKTDAAAIRLADAAERASVLAPKAKEGDMLAIAELTALGAKAQADLNEINSNLSALEG